MFLQISSKKFFAPVGAKIYHFFSYFCQKMINFHQIFTKNHQFWSIFGLKTLIFVKKFACGAKFKKKTAWGTKINFFEIWIKKCTPLADPSSYVTAYDSTLIMALFKYFVISKIYF